MEKPKRRVIKSTIEGKEVYYVILDHIYDVFDCDCGISTGHDDLYLCYLDGSLTIIRDFYKYTDYGDGDTWEDKRTEIIKVILEDYPSPECESLIEEYKKQEALDRLEQVRKELAQKQEEEQDLLQLLGIK